MCFGCKSCSEEYKCCNCGMPMKKESDFGTNADGSVNKKYCIHCYKKGVCQEKSCKSCSHSSCKK